MKNIPHLHTHTYFSLLDGVPSPEDYMSKCDELEIPAIAFTDHGSLSSHAQASIESEKFKTRPILGMEAYVIDSVEEMNRLRVSDSEEDKEKLKKYRSSYHAVLLARNRVGYNNLISINNSSWTNGFYYRNRTDFNSLRNHRDGLICLGGCQSGVVSRHLLGNKKKKAIKAAKKMKDIFGENFYLELQFLDVKYQEELNGKLVEIGKMLDIPCVITNDVHYIGKKDYKLQRILMHLATKGEFFIDSKSNFLKTMEDFEDDFRRQKAVKRKEFLRAIESTFKIMDLCEYTVETGNLYFPKFDFKTHFSYKEIGGKTKEEFFKKLVLKRAKKILGKKLKEKRYKERIIKEYRVLVKLGGIDYFLIVDDLLRYVRDNGAFSVIRGSANGSLIAFVFEFGLIDPVEHSIMFERFISEYRSLNDIDIDIDVRSEFRQEAIRYLKKKYGEQRVLSIGTYNRMQLKGAVKDVTRVLKERIDKKISKVESEDEAERLAEKQEEYLFPTINRVTSIMEGDLTIKSARENYEIFNKWYLRNKKIVKRYIEPVIGNIRNTSLHPAGVVLLPKKIKGLLPIRTQVNPHNRSERIIATAWENSHTGREDLNEIGVMVLDVLGVKTLSIVSEVIELVKKIRGKEIDLYRLNLEDKKTLKMLNKKELIGVFQLSGGAASQIVDITKITEFNDLIVIVSLARPGALKAGAEQDFAKRKVDPSLIKYDHHSLKEILNDSLGVLVFSEHILRTASVFAGMDPQRADALRKIIKGKSPRLFKEYRKEFIKGALKKWSGERDIKDIADKIWKKFSQAGSYLFPRGHASSYALLAYICQYLKVHYPPEFFACHLRYVTQDKYGDVKNVAETVYGIKFVMPNINTPKMRFEVQGDKVLWPLTALKNVGDKAMLSIIENAPFKSLEDFYARVNKRVCNKRVVENLIISGAFKDFGNKRAVITEYKKLRKDKNPDLPLAFSSKQNMSITLEDIYGFEIDSLEKLYKKKLKAFGNFTTYDGFLNASAGERVKVFGRVDKVNIIVTKRGDKMAFSSLRNGKTVYNITLFPDVFKKARRLFKTGNVLVVSGMKNIYNKEHSIIFEIKKGANRFASGSWVREL